MISGAAEKPDETTSTKLGGKSKRVRTIFTPEQLERLEAEFERQQYMVGPERLYLAHTLQLTEAQVSLLIVDLNYKDVLFSIGEQSPNSISRNWKNGRNLA